MWIVRIALNRPYTFIVAALVIILMTPIVLQRTPTDIFPDIDIPVISIAWNYSGLSPQQMEDRIVTNDERFLTTVVDNIEHVESQTVGGRAVIKIFFQPGTDVHVALTQITAVSQTVLRQLPPGISAPLIITYSASAVPILQLGMKGQGLSEQELFDYAVNDYPQPTGDDAGCFDSLPVRRKAAPGLGERGHPGACRPRACRRWM